MEGLDPFEIGRMCAPAQMMQGGDGLQYLLDRVSQLESAPGLILKD